MKKTIIMVNMLIILSAVSFTECKSDDKKTDKVFKEPVVEYSDMEYMAFVMNSTRMWGEIVKRYESEYELKLTDTVILFKLVRAYAGYTNACIGNQDKELFDLNITSAEKYLKVLSKLTPEWSKVYTLESALISSKLAFEPQKGMILGPKNQKAIDKAFKLNENEPLAWYQVAGNKLNTPEQFGGNIPKAIESYEKAILLFESDSSALKNNWQYLSALTWLGIAYDKSGNYSEAIKAFNKALEFEPDFGWIKFVLLPETKKKLSELSAN